MDTLNQIYIWVMSNLDSITSAVAHLCLFASIIVKVTPTLKDDAYLKPVIKFIGKYIALDKYGPGPQA